VALRARGASVGPAVVVAVAGRMERRALTVRTMLLHPPLPSLRQTDAVVSQPTDMHVLLVRVFSLIALLAGVGGSTDAAGAITRAAENPDERRLPAVGERLDYDVKFSAVKVGSGYMEAVGYEPVRGVNALHVKFTVRGGTFFYRVNDVLESWIDTARFVSLRHNQELSEGSRDRTRRFEFFPERSTLSQDGKPEEPGVAEPLDEATFLYFVRRVPLEVGRTYEFTRYFRPDRNPVRLVVLRRERIKVPAGTFNTIVIQPIIKAKGLFSEGGKAQVWLTDDSARVLVQMKSSLPIGSLNLYLRAYRPAAGAELVRGN